ncbi:hypothetical protein ADEAN_000826300 [Angomonas deanei]|uniref:Uncharacterized protein n=1 Tax=Angomonas deanei TaxID=59799 RepID=A0A7G2CLK9_9TRYP|nr:hypothetical protein ADEAN_000826300 [Angomonas deanei]
MAQKLYLRCQQFGVAPGLFHQQAALREFLLQDQGPPLLQTLGLLLLRLPLFFLPLAFRLGGGEVEVVLLGLLLDTGGSPPAGGLLPLAFRWGGGEVEVVLLGLLLDTGGSLPAGGLLPLDFRWGGGEVEVVLLGLLLLLPLFFLPLAFRWGGGK